MLDLCTLGTGGALPLPQRGLASLYVRLSGRGLLIDCGEGTQTAIRRIGWGFRHIDGLLLTHYHGDHCGGLPGFLLSLAKSGREEPFHIWGGPGLRHVVGGLRVVAPQLPYEVVLHEFDGAGSFSLLGMQIESFPLHHSVPCWGYKLTLPRPRGFIREKAEALQIPMKLWGLLQQGQTVTLPDGRTIPPQAVLTGERTGLSFLYATDTRPVPVIAEKGAGTDMMILQGMYGDDEKMPQAHKNRHMLFREAAALAAQAGTKQLVLTHFSNAIDDPMEYLPNAAAIFPNTHCAADLSVWSIDYEGR